MTDAAQATTNPTASAVDYLGLAHDAFQTSTNYFDASIRRQIESAIRQFQGVHPTSSKYHSDAYKSRSRLFRPKTRGMVRKNEAAAAEALFSTRDVVAIEANDDSNQLQLAAAALMKPLMQYRLKRSIPWFLTVLGAYQDSQVAGVCISYQYWDYRKKGRNGKKVDKPCLDLVPTENFRFDPAASWLDPIGTSPYLVHLIPMYVKDVRARMSRTADSVKKPWKPMTPEQILTAMNAYTDSTRNTRERGRTDSTAQATAVNDFAVVWVHRNIMEIEGEDRVWYTLSTTGLLTDPVPLVDEYWHGERPYTLGFSIIETHKNYPDGPVGITKDVQAEVNDMANLRVDNVKFGLQGRYFVKRDKQVDLRVLTRGVPGSAVLMNDPEADVKVIQPMDVTSGSYQEQDRLNLDFDDLSGTFSPSSVQSNRKLNETVGGLNLISTTANQVGAYQLRTFVESWVEPTLRQIMLLEAYYEDDQTILKLAGQAAELTKKFGVTAITDELMQQDLTLSVEVGITAANPQERVNNFMAAMRMLKELLADGALERYGLDVQDVITEIFSHLGYRNGGRFFDRADDPNLNAMQAQVQDLMAQLKQKTNPELVAAQIENLSAKNHDILMGAMEKAVRGFFAAHQTAQMLATVPAIAPVADSVLDAAATMSGNPPTAGQPVKAPDQPLTGVTQGEVKDPRTGVAFTPGTDTSPQTPGSPTAGAEGGVNAGINTMRADSA